MAPRETTSCRGGPRRRRRVQPAPRAVRSAQGHGSCRATGEQTPPASPAPRLRGAAPEWASVERRCATRAGRVAQRSRSATRRISVDTKGTSRCAGGQASLQPRESVTVQLRFPTCRAFANARGCVGQRACSSRSSASRSAEERHGRWCSTCAREPRGDRPRAGRGGRRRLPRVVRSTDTQNRWTQGAAELTLTDAGRSRRARRRRWDGAADVEKAKEQIESVALSLAAGGRLDAVARAQRPVMAKVVADVPLGGRGDGAADARPGLVQFRREARDSRCRRDLARARVDVTLANEESSSRAAGAGRADPRGPAHQRHRLLWSVQLIVIGLLLIARGLVIYFAGASFVGEGHATAPPHCGSGAGLRWLMDTPPCPRVYFGRPRGVRSERPSAPPSPRSRSTIRHAHRSFVLLSAPLRGLFIPNGGRPVDAMLSREIIIKETHRACVRDGCEARVDAGGTSCPRGRSSLVRPRRHPKVGVVLVDVRERELTIRARNPTSDRSPSAGIIVSVPRGRSKAALHRWSRTRSGLQRAALGAAVAGVDEPRAHPHQPQPAREDSSAT